MGIFKRNKHEWEYLPYFEVVEGSVLAVQVCRKTGLARYVKVPSARKLEELEREKE